MSRISGTFDELKAKGRKAFIPFVIAGDPDMETSVQIALELARSGADILELGVPFSDPIADGPTIQASSQRALRHRISVGDVLQIARSIRLYSDVPIVLFSYFNPILSYGLGRLAEDAANAGVDGLLLTDVVDDEAANLSRSIAARGIDLISLIAPSTSDERLERISDYAKGFIYAVARAGVTGVTGGSSREAEKLVRRARKFTNLPVVVGFGISTPAHVEHVWSFADGAVVGSAIVREIEHSIGTGNAVEAVRRFVGTLLPGVAKDTVEI